MMARDDETFLEGLTKLHSSEMGKISCVVQLSKIAKSSVLRVQGPVGSRFTSGICSVRRPSRPLAYTRAMTALLRTAAVTLVPVDISGLSIAIETTAGQFQHVLLHVVHAGEFLRWSCPPTCPLFTVYPREPSIPPHGTLRVRSAAKPFAANPGRSTHWPTSHLDARSCTNHPECPDPAN